MGHHCDKHTRREKRKSKKVCGDLSVKGCIKNLELQLLQDCAIPPTDEVYTQVEQVFDYYLLQSPILYLSLIHI